jgi:hypothetical protein
LPNEPVTPFTPASSQETSIWRAQETLMAAFSNADPESYKAYSTEKSLRMTTDGQSITRDTWLDTIARRQKGRLPVVDEVKVEPYGAWISGIRRDQSPSRATTPKVQWSERYGVWKLHLRYTTLIRP